MVKDLDFDELDRAVNSLITSSPAASDNTENSEKVLDIGAGSIQQPNLSQPIVTVPLAAPLAGRRSSGHFMDVVHPSSDMRRAPIMMPERAPRPNTTTNNPSEESVRPVAPMDSISPDNQPSNSGWPDPIDFREANNEVYKDNEKTPQDQNEDADIDRINDDITNELNRSLDDSPDSPFLSGTKVDKRPLGAFSTGAIAQPSEALELDDVEDDNSVDTAAESIDTDAPLSAELQNELLKVESDSSTAVEEPTEVETPVIATETNVETVQPIGPTSITQQYKEQPSTGDQNTGAIYDTDSYHKPLVHPAKSKSGWMWVLWIVILLAVGAGAGAAVYFFVLPLL